jgi:hypothetical protein
MTNKLLEIQTEILDLDLPPKDRWVHIIKKNESNLHHIFNELDNLELGILGNVSKQTVLLLIATYKWFGKIKYIEELQSIADILNVSVNKIILMQLMYELSTCCTSSIINTDNGPIMIRTMDWDLESLNPLTINLNVVKNGVIIYQATTWVGYVGILTAVKNDWYGLSINYRRSYENTMWDNLKACLSMRYPIGYLVRDIFDNQLSHRDAINILKTTYLIAPCYITVIKKRRNILSKSDDDGLIIQRNHAPNTTDSDTIFLGQNKTLTQTNIDQGCEDPDKDLLWSIDRRHLANSIGEGLLQLGKGIIDIQDESSRTKILEKYMVFPIKNHETRYISLISPLNFGSNCLDSRLVSP